MAQTCGPLWVITTAGTVRPAGTQIELSSVFWTCHKSSNTLTAQIIDTEGRELWSATENCAIFTAYPRPVRANGLTVSVLTGGVLYLQMD